MLRDKAVIGYMGLPDREISVIQSIFSLTEKFHNTYELPRDSERRIADVVFINADDASQVVAWKRFSAQKPSAIPIYVSTDGRSFDDGVPLKRPLVLKKLIDILDSVRHLYTDVNESKGTTTNSRERFNILVVDDSLPVRTYMEQKLSTLAPVMTHVAFAESGDDAIQRMKGDEIFDLVFMDVMMPGIDGYKACKWIKANRPTMVVMLTSRSSPFDKVRGAMSGCDSYLVKPPQDADLERVLKQRVKEISEQRAVAFGNKQRAIAR